MRRIGLFPRSGPKDVRGNPAMCRLVEVPNNINGVEVTFRGAKTRYVVQSLLDLMLDVIKPSIATPVAIGSVGLGSDGRVLSAPVGGGEEYKLKHINLSSCMEARYHKKGLKMGLPDTSLHNAGMAIDISEINHKSIEDWYGKPGALNACMEPGRTEATPRDDLLRLDVATPSEKQVLAEVLARVQRDRTEARSKMKWDKAAEVTVIVDCITAAARRCTPTYVVAEVYGPAAHIYKLPEGLMKRGKAITSDDKLAFDHRNHIHLAVGLTGYESYKSACDLVQIRDFVDLALARDQGLACTIPFQDGLADRPLEPTASSLRRSGLPPEVDSCPWH